MFWLFVNLGGTIHGIASPFALLYIAVWAGPFFLLAKQIRTGLVSVFASAILLVATFGLLVPLFRTSSSTAGIGALFGPIYLFGGVALVIPIDRTLERRSQISERPARVIAEGVAHHALASVRSRSLARLVDLAVLVPFVALWFLGPLFLERTIPSADAPLRGPPAWELPLVFGAPLAFALYEFLMTAKRGQTLGKMALRIRIVAVGRDQSGGDLAPPSRGLGWSKAALRMLMPGLCVVFPIFPPLFFLPYLWAIFDPAREGLHDKIAGTRVVRDDA